MRSPQANLGDQKQVRATPSLQLIPRWRDQHVLIRDFRSLTRYLAGLTVYPRASQHGVFTILKQHRRAAIIAL